MLGDALAEWRLVPRGVAPRDGVRRGERLGRADQLPGICAACYYRIIARMQLAKATSEREDTGDTRRDVLLAGEDAAEESGRPNGGRPVERPRSANRPVAPRGSEAAGSRLGFSSPAGTLLEQNAVQHMHAERVGHARRAGNP